MKSLIAFVAIAFAASSAFAADCAAQAAEKKLAGAAKNSFRRRSARRTHEGGRRLNAPPRPAGKEAGRRRQNSFMKVRSRRANANKAGVRRPRSMASQTPASLWPAFF